MREEKMLEGQMAEEESLNTLIINKLTEVAEKSKSLYAVSDASSWSGTGYAIQNSAKRRTEEVI